MALHQTIDGSFVHSVLNLGFKRGLDGAYGGNLAGCCTLQKWRNELLFFCKRQILTAAPAAAWGVEGGRSRAFV
jgi:hypothetical protein